MSGVWRTAAGSEVEAVRCRYANCYIVRSRGAAVLVDTSFRTDRDAVMAALDAVPRLDAVVLTHSHSDHAGNAAAVQRRFGCPVYVNPWESKHLRRGRSPRPTPGDGSRPLDRLLSRTRLWSRYEPVESFVDQRYPRAVAGGAEMFPTPGHTPGSMSVSVDGEIAIVGDLMIKAGDGRLYPTYADDRASLMETWREMARSEFRLFLPAHGGPIGKAEFDRYYTEAVTGLRI